MAPFRSYCLAKPYRISVHSIPLEMPVSVYRHCSCHWFGFSMSALHTLPSFSLAGISYWASCIRCLPLSSNAIIYQGCLKYLNWLIMCCKSILVFACLLIECSEFSIAKHTTVTSISKVPCRSLYIKK